MRKKVRKKGDEPRIRRNARRSQRLSFQKNPSEENREESRLKGENKVECKKWSAKGTYRKASADREPTTHLNTLGGQRPRADLIQVPTAKFRTWSQRGVSTDGGSYDAGACGKCSNIYFFTKMVSNISKRWNQIEQKQDFWRSLTFEGSQKGAKGSQKGAKGSQKGAKDQENH